MKFPHIAVWQKTPPPALSYRLSGGRLEFETDVAPNEGWLGEPRDVFD